MKTLEMETEYLEIIIWSKKKLLSEQESSITKMTPPKNLGIWGGFIACAYSVTSHSFLLRQNTRSAQLCAVA